MIAMSLALSPALKIPYKQWRVEEAKRRGCSTRAILGRVERGKYPNLKFERVNKRVVFVVAQ